MSTRKLADGSVYEDGEQLLPGILIEITLDLLSRKLPWTAFHVLSSVSRVWQRAISTHEVYRTRVGSKSMHQFVVLYDCSRHLGNVTTFTLLSIQDGSSYHLPLIVGLRRLNKRIFLDGKSYVLGGRSAELYMLDLAGQMQRKRCASMGNARRRTGWGLNDGKIYVFGGCPEREFFMRASKVYDPKQDAWSPTTPMPSSGMKRKVATVGSELFVYGGELYKHYLTFAEVYHPHTDKWRTVENFTDSCRDRVLTVGAKLH